MAETTSRILSLLTLLQTHRQWPGGELAERLGVTERTLRRDIERLRELGYRVDATRGVAGGYRLEAGSQLPPLLLTDEEAVTMAIGLRLAATQGLADGELTTLSALAKFEQVLPSALRERVNALAGVVQRQTPRTWRNQGASDSTREGAPDAEGPSGTNGAPSTNDAAEPTVSHDLLGRLALACRDHERIRFHYTAANGAETRRVVEPQGLVAAARHWFFVCWDLQREDWRTFRVDRMSELLGTRVHVAPRELPAADAAEFVRLAHASLRRRQSVEVLLDMPLAEMKASFGGWADDAEAVDAHTTRWPVQGETDETLLAALAWIPPGVRYELRGSGEFLAFVAESAERMRGAVPAHSSKPSGEG